MPDIFDEVEIDEEVRGIMSRPHQFLPPSVRVRDEFGNPVGAPPDQSAAVNRKRDVFDDLPDARPEFPYPEMDAAEMTRSQRIDAPPSSLAGSFAGSASSMTLNTAAAGADLVGRATDEATLPMTGGTAVDPANQPRLLQAGKELTRLNATEPPRVGYFDAGAGDFYREREAKANALAREIQQLQTKPVDQSAAGILRDAASKSYEEYGANPESTNRAAQVGRGAGMFAASLPAMLTSGPLALGQMGGSAYEEAYGHADKQARATGETDEAKIEERAKTEGVKAAAKVAPQLALYAVGGKLAAGLAGKLVGDAAPALTRAAAGFAGAEVANVGAGSVIRALEAPPGERLDAAIPKIENLTADTLFAVFHGVGEYSSVSAEARAKAQEELRTRGFDDAALHAEYPHLKGVATAEEVKRWTGDAPPEPLFAPETAAPADGLTTAEGTPEVTAPDAVGTADAVPARAVPVDLAPVVEAADMPLTAEAIRKEPVAAPVPPVDRLADILKEFNDEPPTEASAKENAPVEGARTEPVEAPREEAASEVRSELTAEQEAEWRAMQEEHEAEMRGSLEEAPGSHELLEAVRNVGGLPSLENDASLNGETRRLWEASKGRMMRLANKTQELSLDGVRESLEQYGFKFDTAHAMLDALETRIATGKEVRGFEPGGGGTYASKAEPVFEPRLRTAYDALVKRSRFGFPAVSIGELARESGVPLADLKARLFALHKQGRVVLSKGDWSLSSPETRAGMIEVNGDRMTQVRPMDVLTSKTPATPEGIMLQRLSEAAEKAKTEAEWDASGKQPGQVEIERPGGGKVFVLNTKEALLKASDRYRPPSDSSHLQRIADAVEPLKQSVSGVRVRVLRNEADLPDRTRKSLTAGDRHEGIIDTDRAEAFLFADHITSPERAREVFAHEVVGHYGVEKLVGPAEWQKIAASVLKEVPAAARDVAAAYTKKDSAFRKTKNLSDLTPAERALVAREYVARLAEKPSLAPKTWERIVAAVRRALKKLGIQKEWSEADIRDLLRRAAREVEAPRAAGREAGIMRSVKDLGPEVARLAPNSEAFESAFEKRVPEYRREDVNRYVADTLAGSKTVELSGAEKTTADRFVRLFADLKADADAAGVGKQVVDAYRAALAANPGMTLPERVATLQAETERAKRASAPASPAAPAMSPDADSGGAPVGEPPRSTSTKNAVMEADGGDGSTTALKRAVVDLQREVQGGEEIPVQTRIDSEELIRQAGEAVAGDPGMAARIVARILATEHHDDLAVSRRDAAVMLVERTRLRNERSAAQALATNANALPEERAQAASDLAYAGEQIDRLDRASRAAGTAWSDFGRLYQQVQRSDYTVEAQTRRLESAKGSPLTNTEKASVQSDVSEIERGEEAAKKRTEEIQAEASRQAASDMLAGFEPPVKASKTVLDLAERIVGKLERAADAARKRMRERLGKTSAGVDPTVLYDVAVIGLSKLGRASLDFAHWSAEMVDEFDAMDFDVRPFLNEAWTKTQEMWAAEEAKLTGPQKDRIRNVRTKRVDLLSDRLGIYDGIMAAAKEGAHIGGELDKFVKLYVKNLVDSGVRGLDPVFDRVMQDLGSLFPDATRRQMMDAFSDYGKSTPATAKEADRHRAEIRREAQLTSAITDVESGIAPRATGKGRNPLSAAGRALTRLLNEAKRRFNIQPADPAAALRSALDARKTYYHNRMQDLAFEIARKERVIREKSLSPTDAELDSLKAAYEVVKADHEAVFGKREMTDEQKLQQAVKIAERNERIAADQLEKAKVGIFEAPRKAGVKPTAELEAIRARAEAMRAETAELKSQAFGMDAAKRESALAAKIEDLNGKLIAGNIDAAAAGPRVEPSARAEALKAEYDAMRGLLSDLRRDADPRRAPDAVEARKLVKIQKAIDALDAKIQAGDVSVKARKPSTDSADAEFLKAQRATMMKLLADMRRESSKTVMTPEERALKAYGTRLAHTEADLADRNLRADAGDASAFRRKPRKPVDISRDPALVAQKVRIEEAKTNLARKEAAFEKAQRNGLEKILEGISGWRRAFVLSGVHTLAKLTSAAGEIVTIAPIEEAVGGVLGKLPLIRRAAEQAPRHGGFSPAAEWEAITETTTKLFKDAGDYMKRGATDLDSVYGKPRIEPFEFKELLGRMHGALKTPARRNEWTRSYRKRMEFAAKAGADISSPLVQTRIGLEAYEDANRSIFMESNMVVEAYKRGLSRFAQKDAAGHASTAGKIAETTARVLVPIVKIPTNLVARTFEYTFGSVTGLTKLGFALARGIDTLPPEQADIIMRNLKRGSLGAAVLAIGYLNPNSIGGYYNGPNDAGDVKHGEIEIYGHSIPKVLIHNPLLEQLQIGATIRRVADSKLKKSDKETQGIGVGAVAASLGVLKEVPFLNVVNRTGEAIRGSESFGTYAGDQIRGLVVPQGVDEMARFFDRDSDGETVRRSPKTILERIQSSIPFYRNELPEKRRK